MSPSDDRPSKSPFPEGPKDSEGPRDPENSADSGDPAGPARGLRGGEEPVANAFSAGFLDRLRRHHDHPATPEAANAGPWRVVRSEPSASGPTWSCIAAGETAPRAHLVTPDLAFLAAAAFPLTGEEPRFFLAEDPDIEAPVCDLLDGDSPVGVVDGWNAELAGRMSTLDALRRRPLALAHFLLAVGDETLRRVGRILLELAEEDDRGS